MSLTTTIPLKLGTTQVSRFVSGEGVGLAWGGTGQDLSASGGATFVLAQDASHVISARALIAADIPSLDAAKITTGTIPLARGGTNADLSATGGTSKFLKQATAGANVTVVQPTLADLAAGTLGVDLQLGAVGVKFGGAGTLSSSVTQICALAANQSLAYDVPSGYYHGFRFGSVNAHTFGYSPTLAWSSANTFQLGDGSGAYFLSDGFATVHNVASGYAHKLEFVGTEKYRFSAALCEFDRLSLGGTIGSSVDPGAGGIYAAGNAKLDRLYLGTSGYWVDPGMGGINIPGVIRFYSGYGASIADTTLAQIYSDGGAIFQNVASGQYLGSKIAGTLKFTLGYSTSIGTFSANTFQLGDYSTNSGIISDGAYVYHNATSTHQFKVSGSTKFTVDSDCTAAGNFKFSTSSSAVKGTNGLYIYGEGGSGGTATSGFVALGGGHSYSSTHGALLAVYGITAGGTGSIHLACGAVAGASHVFYDKNSAQQLKIDESGSEFKQYVSGGASGLLVYSNRSSNAVALYLSGGSQTTGFSTSAGALIQLAGSGGSGHALYYTATTAGASHYFYDKTATAQARIYEGGLLVYGGFGMAGIGPVGRQTLSAASTDLATVITLANSIRTALIAFGLGV